MSENKRVPQPQADLTMWVHFLKIHIHRALSSLNDSQLVSAIGHLNDALDAADDVMFELSDRELIKRWHEAVTEFLRTSNWPGGPENFQLIRDRIESMGLIHSPSVESLKTAYEDLKRSGTLKPFVYDELLARGPGHKNEQSR
jgi:hypothetical protein